MGREEKKGKDNRGGRRGEADTGKGKQERRGRSRRAERMWEGKGREAVAADALAAAATSFLPLPFLSAKC